MANRKKQNANAIYDFFYKKIIKGSPKLSPDVAKGYDWGSLISEAYKYRFFIETTFQMLKDPELLRKNYEYVKTIAMIEKKLPANQSVKLVIRTDNIPAVTGDNAPGNELFLTRIIDFKAYKPGTPVIAEGPFVKLGEGGGGTSIVEVRGKRPTETLREELRKMLPEDQRKIMHTIGVLYGIRDLMYIPTDTIEWDKEVEKFIKKLEQMPVDELFKSSSNTTEAPKEAGQDFLNANKDYLNGDKSVAEKDLPPTPQTAQLPPAYVGDVADKDGVHFASLPPSASQGEKLYYELMHTSYDITRLLAFRLSQKFKTPAVIPADFVRRVPFPGPLECKYAINPDALRNLHGKKCPGVNFKLGALLAGVLLSSPELSRYFAPHTANLTDDSAWKISMLYGHYRRFNDPLAMGDCCCLNDPTHIGGRRYVIVISAHDRVITEGISIENWKYAYFKKEVAAEVLYAWVPAPHKLLSDNNPLGKFWGPSQAKLNFLLSHNYGNIGAANTQEMFLSWIFQNTGISPRTVKEAREMLRDQIFPISPQTPAFPCAIVFDYKFENIGMVLSNANVVLMHWTVKFMREFAPVYVWYPH